MIHHIPFDDITILLTKELNQHKTLSTDKRKDREVVWLAELRF